MAVISTCSNSATVLFFTVIYILYIFFIYMYSIYLFYLTTFSFSSWRKDVACDRFISCGKRDKWHIKCIFLFSFVFCWFVSFAFCFYFLKNNKIKCYSLLTIISFVSISDWWLILGPLCMRHTSSTTQIQLHRLVTKYFRNHHINIGPHSVKNEPFSFEKWSYQGIWKVTKSSVDWCHDRITLH